MNDLKVRTQVAEAVLAGRPVMYGMKFRGTVIVPPNALVVGNTCLLDEDED